MPPLIAGSTPDEYATNVGVAMSTVRSQLRAIFEKKKTCTRSQSEAVGAMLWVLSQHKPQS